ncbi:hypothetical protein ATANTOWER_021771 [Ataeniobius toweri]|uniref:Nucleoporin NUP188 n=1 Tax=Ataeniobius toweri TaxID=208326 RepID=A0ABU7AW06_9TELE|nr:hypothetical protein [Ataeniobius toweri]
MAESEMSFRSCRELWTILLGRSALREPAQIEGELDRHWDRLHQGLGYYKPPSSSSAGKVKDNKDVAQPLKDFGFRISKLLNLDEQQSVQLLQCYLQEDYRGTRDSLKVVLKDERQSQALLLKMADYYYEERMCLLRCVLLLLTYFQDERHPYRTEYSNCVNKLEKDLVSNYQSQFENLFKAEAPTWETHGNLMTERQVSRWFMQCLREQSLLLEIIFLYYAYFEMSPADLLSFTKMFKGQGFGLRQTNRHLVDKSLDALVDRIGYLSSLILVEGMDIDFLHKCALEDCTEQHQFSGAPDVIKEMDQLLLTFGDIPHHGPVLLAWVLLRHTLRPDESNPVIRRIGNTALQLGVFKYLSTMLKGLGASGNNCTASTAKMCIYGLLSFVITSFEEESLQANGVEGSHLIEAACEVLSAPSLAEVFWEMKPNRGLGMILDSAAGMFPHKIGPLLQLLTALVSNKSTVKKVYNFLDKMSFYTQVYKHKPNDIISKDDETLWRRQSPKLLYPLGTGQTNLWMPQGVLGQVMIAGEQGYMVRWDYSFSAWTLFTCEVEMLLHVVSTADVIAHCTRVKPILDLVHKIISIDWTVSDCLLPLTSRIYMLLQRLTSVINPPVDVIASCVNCLSVLAARMPGKVWSSLHHTGFLPFASNPLTNMAQCISAEGMKAGNYGNLLVQIEQPRGEYAVTIAFLRLITTLVKGQLGNTQSKGLIPCVLLVLKEMLPTYHKWRYNTYGVRERIGCHILELIHAILNLSPEGEDQGSTPTLQSLCIYSLANTEAGQAVVNIMAVGVDTIDVVLAAQPSSCGSEGPGQILIQTVKLAFSVTNNVIRLKPPSDAVSPLEQALTQHGGHGSNLIVVLAKYIYHKHDPALPRLAIQLLKRLATVAPMSVYACLGSDAAAIRDAFLARLQSKTEDMRIKVMILEFLTVAVETQPGLIELFLNLEVKDGNEGSKEFLVGEWSCLHVVLDLINSKQQGKYWCPPLLHRAALAFLLALWQDRRDSAISVLRTKDRFWENLTTPLFGTLTPPSDTTEPCVLEACAFVMKIIGLEIYYVVSGSLEQSLKDGLQKFSNARRYDYWSQYVKLLVCHVAETEEEGICCFPETQMLISAWRMLLILSTTHTPPPAPLGGAQGIPRPAQRHSPSSVSWAVPWASVPGTPPRLPAPTVNSVGEALIPPPEAPDGTADLTTTATGNSIDNGRREHGPLGLYVSNFPRNLVRALQEVGVEYILAEGSLYAWACQVCPAFFLTITPFQASLLFPTWALKSPSRITETLGGALCSTPDRDAKKAGYSALPLGPLDETTVRDPSPTQMRRGCDPLIHRGKPQHETVELAGIKQTHPSLPPLPAGHSRVEESPTSLEELGTRAHAVCGEDSTKLKLFMDVLDGTKAALTTPTSVPCLRLGSMMATLLLILLKQWRSVVAAAPDILSPLSLILERTLQADQQMMDRTKAKIFSALISVLQIQGLNGGDISQLPQLLLSVCETVKDEALALIDNTRHVSQMGDMQEHEDSMETDSPRGLQKDQRDGVCVLALHLAKELCRTDEDGEYWVLVMRKVPVLPSVLSAVEISLRCKHNLYFTEAALHLLLTLARTPQVHASVSLL